MDGLHPSASKIQQRLSSHGLADLNEDGIPVAVLAKKSSFTPQRKSRRAATSGQIWEPQSALPALAPGFLTSSRAKISKCVPYSCHVAPVDDNAPFFFFTLNLDQVLHHQGMKEGMDWKVNLGVAFWESGARHLLRSGDSLPAPLAMGAGTARVNAGGLCIWKLLAMGLHHGGDCVYSEIRPGGSQTYALGSGGISFVAFQWHWRF